MSIIEKSVSLKKMIIHFNLLEGFLYVVIYS